MKKPIATEERFEFDTEEFKPLGIHSKYFISSWGRVISYRKRPEGKENYYKNLYWTTHRDNIVYAGKRMARIKGNHKLTLRQVKLIRRSILPARVLAKKLKVVKSCTINKIRRGQLWQEMK